MDRVSSENVIAFRFRCPQCTEALNRSAELHCQTCGYQSVQVGGGIIQLLRGLSEHNVKNQRAYSLYSLLYAPISLLAYTIVWRGNIFKHIRFFRDFIRANEPLLDIATGDGSLTHIALAGGQGKFPVVALDISEEMLSKAARKIKHPDTRFVMADVENIPLADESLSRISCFGGLNSFPSLSKAFSEMARVLRRGGKLRGSALLVPKARWKRRLIGHWIEQGYQSCILTRADVVQAAKAAGLELSLDQNTGDVFLFEFTRPL